VLNYIQVLLLLYSNVSITILLSYFRLLPYFADIPVAIKNYGLSMTSVSLSHFAVTALFGEAPGSLAAVWMGASSRDLVGLLHGDASASGSSDGGGHVTAQVAVDVAGAASLVLVLGILGRRIRNRLNALEHHSLASSAPGGARDAPVGGYARVT